MIAIIQDFTAPVPNDTGAVFPVNLESVGGSQLPAELAYFPDYLYTWDYLSPIGSR